jgi:hypothetical protein
VLVETEQGYSRQTFDLKPGRTADAVFELTPWSAITGRLTNQTGAPIPDLPVQIAFDSTNGPAGAKEDAWPGGDRFRAEYTDADGRFSIDRLPARKVRLTVGAPGRESFLARVSGGAAGLSTQSFPRLSVHPTPKVGETLDLGTLVVDVKE